MGSGAPEGVQGLNLESHVGFLSGYECCSKPGLTDPCLWLPWVSAPGGGRPGSRCGPQPSSSPPTSAVLRR